MKIVSKRTFLMLTLVLSVFFVGSCVKDDSSSSKNEPSKETPSSIVIPSLESSENKPDSIISSSFDSQIDSSKDDFSSETPSSEIVSSEIVSSEVSSEIISSEVSSETTSDSSSQEGPIYLPDYTFDEQEFTYDMKPHSIYIKEDLPEGVIVTYTNNNQFNAGEYEVTAHFTDTTGKYVVPVDAIGTLIINKADYELPKLTLEDKTFDYDGLPHNLEIKEELPRGIGVTYTPSNLVEPGTYEVIASFVSYNPNYNEITTTLKATLTINENDNYERVNITFKQDGYEDIVKTIPKGSSLLDVPTPQKVVGYNVSWSVSNFNFIQQDLEVTLNKEAIYYTITYHYDSSMGYLPSYATKEYTIEYPTFRIADFCLNDQPLFFIGWTTTQEFNKDKVVTEIKQGSFGNIDLYAHHELIYWDRLSENISGDMNQITIETEENTINLNNYLTFRDKATFEVYSSSDLQNPIDKTKISLEGEDSYYMIAATSLYSGKTYNINLNIRLIVNISYKVYLEDQLIDEKSNIYLKETLTCNYQFEGYKIDGFVLDQDSTKYQEYTFTKNGEYIFHLSFNYIIYHINYDCLDLVNDSRNPTYFTVKDMQKTIPLYGVTKPGYAYQGFIGSNSYSYTDVFYPSSLNDVTLTLQLELIVYNVNYHIKDGFYNPNQTTFTYNDGEIVLQDLVVAPGYKFIGWYDTPNFMNKITKIDCTTFDSENIDIYPRYDLVEYIVHYDPLDGVMEGSDTLYYTAEQGTIYPNKISKEHFEFVGWFANNSQITQIYPGIFGESNEIYLKPYFKRKTVTINFKDVLDGKLVKQYEWKYPEGIETPLDDGYQEGYTFLGYYLDDSRQTKVTSVSSSWTGTITIIKSRLYGNDCLEFTMSSNGTYSVTGFDEKKVTDGMIQYLNIPSMHNGEKVTSIGVGAFENMRVMQVDLPDTITSINARAFKNSEVSYIKHLSKNLYSIGQEAFMNCILEYFVIPDTVEFIGKGAFINNKSEKLPLFTSRSEALPDWSDDFFPYAVYEFDYGGKHGKGFYVLKDGTYAMIGIQEKEMNGKLVNEVPREIGGTPVTRIGAIIQFWPYELDCMFIPDSITTIDQSAKRYFTLAPSIIIEGNKHFEAIDNATWNQSGEKVVVYNYGGTMGVTEEGYIYVSLTDGTCAIVLSHDYRVNDYAIPSQIEGMIVSRFANGHYEFDSLFVPSTCLKVDKEPLYMFTDALRSLPSWNFTKATIVYDYQGKVGTTSEGITWAYTGNNEITIVGVDTTRNNVQIPGEIEGRAVTSVAVNAKFVAPEHMIIGLPKSIESINLDEIEFTDLFIHSITKITGNKESSRTIYIDCTEEEYHEPLVKYDYVFNASGFSSIVDANPERYWYYTDLQGNAIVVDNFKIDQNAKTLIYPHILEGHQVISVDGGRLFDYKVIEFENGIKHVDCIIKASNDNPLKDDIFCDVFYPRSVIWEKGQGIEDNIRAFFANQTFIKNGKFDDDLHWTSRGENQDYTYLKNDDAKEVYIVSYLGKERILTIPEKIEGYKVTRLLNRSFRNHLVDVLNCNSSLKYIHDYAFDHSGVGVFNFNEGLVEIGDWAFEYRDSINEPIGNVPNITFPSTLKRIGMYAFRDYNVQVLNLNEGLEEIGELAFQNSDMNKIIIPLSIKKIEYGALALAKEVYFRSKTMPEGVSPSAFFNEEKIVYDYKGD